MRACVRACVRGWVGGWVGGCVCVCVSEREYAAEYAAERRFVHKAEERASQWLAGPAKMERHLIIESTHAAFNARLQQGDGKVLVLKPRVKKRPEPKAGFAPPTASPKIRRCILHTLVGSRADTRFQRSYLHRQFIHYSSTLD